MLGYINKISFLEEKASVQVAINFCQENGFKAVALNLEKRSCYLNDAEKVSQWDTAIDEQGQRLTVGIPHFLRQRVQHWINRIALEYLSYSRRQEELFGVSRYFLMNIFTRGDWKAAARLDEKKLAQRLLEDKRLTVLQRYRIACVYCLHVHIPQLWERLTQEEKQLTIGNGKYSLSEETHDMVLLWSHYMNGNYICEQKNHLWTVMVSLAMRYGNCTALMLCWKEIQEDIRQNTVIDRALESLKQWNYCLFESKGEESVKQKLLSNQSPRQQYANSIKDFNLPSYYSELMGFFLSQMDQEQQLRFFKKSFQKNYYQSEYHKSVLECFLDWPHQDDFLPTINRLWGVIPKEIYGQCLVALASKCSENNKKANRDYDYQSLLGAFWKETPQEYKHYMFCDYFCKTDYEGNHQDSEKLLSWLLESSLFQEKGKALFKLIFCDQPQENKKAMMHSKLRENMCSLLIKNEKWSFLNCLLEECLPQEEISSFKKRFIQSDCGIKLCLDIFKENRESLVKDLLDWSLESDADKEQCKDDILSRYPCLYDRKSFLCKKKLAEMACVINFCLSSDEEKEQFKEPFTLRTCGALLEDYAHDSSSEDCVWEQMDAIIAWTADTEEKRRDFKKGIFFFYKGIDIHYKLVFIQGIWEKVERFYQWFSLSPEEIKKLKLDTFFTLQTVTEIYDDFPNNRKKLEKSFRWCLTNEEMVISFKKKIKYEYLIRRQKKFKKFLDDLVSDLLDGFRRKEIQKKTGRKGILMKGTRKKRSSMENESSFPRKRCK